MQFVSLDISDGHTTKIKQKRHTTRQFFSWWKKRTETFFFQVDMCTLQFISNHLGYFKTLGNIFYYKNSLHTKKLFFCTSHCVKFYPESHCIFEISLHISDSRIANSKSHCIYEKRRWIFISCSYLSLLTSLFKKKYFEQFSPEINEGTDVWFVRKKRLPLKFFQAVFIAEVLLQQKIYNSACAVANKRLRCSMSRRFALHGGSILDMPKMTRVIFRRIYCEQ